MEMDKWAGGQAPGSEWSVAVLVTGAEMTTLTVVYSILDECFDSCQDLWFPAHYRFQGARMQEPRPFRRQCDPLCSLSERVCLSLPDEVVKRSVR